MWAICCSHLDKRHPSVYKYSQKGCLESRSSQQCVVCSQPSWKKMSVSFRTISLTKSGAVKIECAYQCEKRGDAKSLLYWLYPFTVCYRETHYNSIYEIAGCEVSMRQLVRLWWTSRIYCSPASSFFHFLLCSLTNYENMSANKQ